MKLLFVTFLLFAIYGTPRVFGQTLEIQTAPVQVPAYQVLVPYAPPPVIYRPQVQMIPYELDRTEVIRREYRTPLRDLLFGRYRINNYYRPQVEQ